MSTNTPMDVREFFRLALWYCEEHECGLCPLYTSCPRDIMDRDCILEDTIKSLREWEASHGRE